MEVLNREVNTHIDSWMGPRDPRVRGWFLLDDYLPTLNRQPLSLRGIMVVYNLGLTLLSLYMFCEVRETWNLSGGYSSGDLSTFGSNKKEIKLSFVSCGGYYFSKVIEFMDTFFFILRKNNHQDHVPARLPPRQHAEHLVVRYELGAMWPCESYFGAAFNSFIHVLMYSYYGLSAVPSLRPYLWWKRYITQGQLVQFVMTMFQTSCAVVWPCGFPMGWLYFQISYMVSLIILFTNFYVKTYKRRGGSKAKDHQNGSLASKNGHVNGAAESGRRKLRVD
uniref:Elongation of very long chain fatty acids protein n=1 Tax=Denticeps clupeoides TaxID=299321 RepID=A0AAY4C2N1_9TELE